MNFKFYLVAGLVIGNTALFPMTGFSGSKNGQTSAQEIYEGSCAACHGQDGEGEFPGVPDFSVQQGLLAKPRTALMKNILEGYESSNSTMAMPPRGGNPDLSEREIGLSLDYLINRFGTTEKRR